MEVKVEIHAIFLSVPQESRPVKKNFFERDRKERRESEREKEKINSQNAISIVRRPSYVRPYIHSLITKNNGNNHI